MKTPAQTDTLCYSQLSVGKRQNCIQKKINNNNDSVNCEVIQRITEKTCWYTLLLNFT